MNDFLYKCGDQGRSGGGPRILAGQPHHGTPRKQGTPGPYIVVVVYHMVSNGHWEIDIGQLTRFYALQ